MRKIVVTFLALMICIPMMGAILKGTVKDASGVPIYGASVVIDEHHSNGPKYVVTDDQGRFRVFVLSGEHEVAIRMVGYETILEKLTISCVTHKDFIMYEKRLPSLANNSEYSEYAIKSNPNNNSNCTYNRSDSDGVSIGAVIAGAIIIGGTIAIFDALSSSSSKNKSNSSSSLDPCWSNDISGSDKVWLSEADFSQITDYRGNSKTEVTIKFHNENNWPMKVTYQVVYKNEKSSDVPDMRWIGLEKDDKSTTEVIYGQEGKEIECIKLRKIEPTRY